MDIFGFNVENLYAFEGIFLPYAMNQVFGKRARHARSGCYPPVLPKG
jgi:hypothetical protein